MWTFNYQNLCELRVLLWSTKIVFSNRNLILGTIIDAVFEQITINVRISFGFGHHS